MPAYPTRLMTGYTHDDRVVGDIVADDRARSDERVATDRRATNDSRVGADGGASSDKRPLILVAARNLGTWINDIREHAGGSAEDKFFEHDTFIERDVVLNLCVVTHDNPRRDEYVLP